MNLKNLLTALIYPRASGEKRPTVERSRQMHGEIYKIAWPATVESIFVGLVGLVDTIMVSGLGTTAVAAVGLTNQPKFIALAFIQSLNVGVTAIIARRIGEKRLKEANNCLRQALFLSAAISVVVCLLSFVFARPYILAAGAKEDTIDMAVVYFRIIIIGQIFQGIGLTINTAQRCVGNSKLSMRTNIAANVVNIIFNYLLIGGHFGFPRWGVAGAAVATSLGSLVSFGMALQSILSGKSVLRLRRRGRWLPEREMVHGIAQVSSSAFLEQACLRIGFFIYALIVANLGTTMFATHQICMNIANLTFTCFDGYAVAAAAMVGRSLGAGHPDDAEVYARSAQRQSMVFATAVMAMFLFLRYPMMHLFSEEEVVVTYGARILLMLGFSAHAMANTIIYAGALRGAGDTRFVAFFSLISTTVVRPILSYVLCYPMGMGLIGPWIAFMVDFYLRCALNYAHFCRGGWKHIRL